MIPLGILVDGIGCLPALVDALLDHPLVATTDTGVGGPLYKATPALAAAHKQLRAPRERLHAYLRLGLLDESVRVQVAQRFAAGFRRRFGRGDRRELFYASADMVRVAVGLRPLSLLDVQAREAVLQAIAAHPHDQEVLERERARVEAPADSGADGVVGASDLELYGLELKLFVDHLLNPWRYKDPAVSQALAAAPLQEPVVFELWAGPALPGYGFLVVEELARTIDGRPLWLELEDEAR